MFFFFQLKQMEHMQHRNNFIDNGGTIRHLSVLFQILKKDVLSSIKTLKYN